MNHLLKIVILMALLNPFTSSATEVTDCFDQAYAHPDNGGLGLNRGQAIRLCKRATNTEEIVECFVKAWGHKDDGGMGLHLGGAVDLCKQSPME